MEAVAPNAGLVELWRQGESLRDVGVRAVECRVEADHLRKLRRALEQCRDRGQAVGLVQGRQRDQLLQGLEHARIHADRRGVVEATVDDPVTDADQSVTGEVLAEEPHEVLYRVIVAESHLLAPRLLGHGSAGRIPDHQTRRRGEALDLAAHLGREVAIAREKQ